MFHSWANIVAMIASAEHMTGYIVSDLALFFVFYYLTCLSESICFLKMFSRNYYNYSEIKFD